MAASSTSSRTRLRRLLAWAGLAASGLVGGSLAAWFWTSGETTYLDLQASSDPVHRAALIALPGALGVLALTWMLSELGRLRAWLRWIGRSSAAVALVGLFGLPVFVAVHDLRLEALGLAGQFEPGPAVAGPAAAPAGPAGLYQETSAEVPNFAIEGLAANDLLTLDRRGLARKRPDGSFVWHTPRPGPPPASLLVDGARIYYTGLGEQYEDDTVVAAYDLASGLRLWSIHSLGNAVSPPVVAGDRLAFSSWRPASSSVHLIDLATPAVRWSARLAGEIRLAPRFEANGLRVAVAGEVVRLAIDTGAVLERTTACGPQRRPEVACQDGRVVAWQRGVP